MSEAILYIPESTARIQYAVQEIFARRAGFQVLVTDNAAQYVASSIAFKFHYSDENLPGIGLFRSGFLDETGVKQDFIPAQCRLEEIFCLFPDETLQRFDLLAMVFWCLSRYEEYQPFVSDKHGRFPASASLLQNWGVVEEPICDIAIQYCFQKWGIAADKKFSIVPTLDIDIAFAYAGRGLARSMGGAFKAPWSLPERIKSILNPSLDPNNTFSYIHKALESCEGARVFWHCGSENNRYDKQVDLDYGPFKDAIGQISNGSRCGLHPSFAAYQDEKVLRREKQYLEQVLGSVVSCSRMHYILLSLPSTYRTLTNCGITEDYSMGFADAVGFRAGTSQPFSWYDLEAETSTHLEVYPFCIMEATCLHYLQMSPDQAIAKGFKLKERVQRHGGNFCFIFHNESLGSHVNWRGWDKVFEAWMA